MMLSWDKNEHIMCVLCAGGESLVYFEGGICFIYSVCIIIVSVRCGWYLGTPDYLSYYLGKHCKELKFDTNIL